MFGDVVQEITPEGTIVYQWNSWENLDIETDVIYHLEGRREWTCQNALKVTPNGDLLVSFRQTSTVGIVNKERGEFSWKRGRGRYPKSIAPHSWKMVGCCCLATGPTDRGELSPHCVGRPGDQRGSLGVRQSLSRPERRRGWGTVPPATPTQCSVATATVRTSQVCGAKIWIRPATPTLIVSTSSGNSHSDPPTIVEGFFSVRAVWSRQTIPSLLEANAALAAVHNNPCGQDTNPHRNTASITLWS
jgi:hypothetical protein